MGFYGDVDYVELGFILSVGEGVECGEGVEVSEVGCWRY